MPLRAIARLIQTMLYAQRFFPYYVYNILGGIEEDGEPSLTFIFSTLPTVRVYCETFGIFDGWVNQANPIPSYAMPVALTQPYTLLASAPTCTNVDPLTARPSYS